MIYLINSSIKFRQEDGALWSVEDEDSTVTLTVTMSRLLTYLLERRGQVVTRDELLENIWDQYGLRSSNHTLNKYISEIRKHFSKFGEQEECIITVPGMGFMFSSNIDVQFPGRNQLKINSVQINKNNESSACIVDIDSRKGFNEFKYTTGMFLTVAISFFSIISIDSYIKKAEVNLTNTKSYHVFDYKGCPVFSTRKINTNLAARERVAFFELAQKNNIICHNDISFIYSFSNAYIWGMRGSAFISQCSMDDNAYTACINYFWSSY